MFEINSNENLAVVGAFRELMSMTGVTYNCQGSNLTQYHGLLDLTERLSVK